MQRLNNGRFNISYFQSHNVTHDCKQLLLYSTSISSNSFVDYLVHSLGFTHQQALSTSTKLSRRKKVECFKFDANANSVVGFFKKHGFNDSHIMKIVSTYPRVLCSNVDHTLLPKLKFLQDQGFSSSDIHRVIAKNPCLLSYGIDSSISPSFRILRQLLVSDTHVIAIVKKLHFSSLKNITSLLSNVTLLRGYGIPIELIRKHLLSQPAAYSRNPEKFKDIVIRVEKKLGIPKDSAMFLYGITLLSGCSEETIESKCRMFMSFGWTQSEVETFMMKNTCCFFMSESNIKKKLDFLMNELRLEPAYLTANTHFLTCSLEKRIVPRHKILLTLKEKGLLKKDPFLSSAIVMTEPCFLKKFVIPFQEVHQFYANITGCSIKMLTQQRADDLQCY